MNCYTHTARAAVGICAACGKAVCRECVGADTPRLVCAACVARGTAPPVGWARGGYYGVGWEYRSSIALGSWPLVHLCFGRDPVTYRPRVAKGVIAVGNAAVGVLAIGGAAVGFMYAIGGGAVAPAVLSGGRCDQAALDVARRWLQQLPASCR